LAKATPKRSQELLDHDAFHCWNAPYGAKRISDFAQAGINIHNPKYGMWWENSAHRSASRAYNNEWRRFLDQSPKPTEAQMIDFGRNLATQYGLSPRF